MKKKVVVIGSYNTDLTIKTNKLPTPGETVIGGRFTEGSGGKGANQAVAAARAGARVSFIARIGNDTLGKVGVRRLAAEGINTDFITQDAEYQTGVAFILVDDQGENSIVVASGANARLSPSDINRAEREISSADVMLLQLESPLETIGHAIHLAHKHKTLVILNPAPAQQLQGAWLREIDIITPNRIEAEMLAGMPITGDASLPLVAQKILDSGIQNVIITLGERGAFLASKNVMTLVPAYEVQAIDSTGAGDVFSGSLATFLAEGMSMEQSVRKAIASASLSVTRMGALTSAPHVQEIKEFIATHATSGTEV